MIEIERQVNSLKRQASKAERYKKVSAELKQAEMELLVMRSGSLSGELDELKKEIRGLSDRLEELRAKHSKEAVAEQQNQEEISAVATQLSERTQKLYECKESLASLDHQSQRLRDRMGTNQSRRAQIEEEYAELDQRAGDLDERRRRQDSRIEQAQADEKTAAQEYEDQKRIYDELQAGVTEMTDRIEQMSRQIMNDRDDLARCTNEIRVAETLVARCGETKLETEAELTELKSAVEGHAARREELQDQLQKIEKRAAAKHGELSSLQIRHGETHGSIADLAQRLEQTRRELHQSQARLETLEELKASFEGFYQGVREVMQAAANKKLRGVIGPLANELRSSPEHETALEAALGPHLQTIVVKKTKHARAAMDWIIGGSRGSATFWPLEGATAPTAPADLSAALAHRGVIAHAPALIDTKDTIKPILATLLNTTLVVNDFDTGLKLKHKLAAYDLVTLDGRTIYASGAMGGGKTTSAGLLSREREIQELTERLQTLKTQEEASRKEIAGARETAEALGQEIQARSDEVHQLKIEKADLDKDRQTAGEAYDQAHKNRVRREEQRAGLESEIESHRALIREKEEQKTQHERSLADLSAEVESVREKARAQTDDFKAQGMDLSSAHVELGKVRERLTHLAEGRETLDRERQTLDADRESRRGEEQRLRDEDAQSQEKIERIGEQLQDFSKRREELVGEIHNDRAQHEALEMHLKELNRRLEALDRDERAAENDLHEKQLRFTEFQTTLNHLSEEARQKFNLGLEEIAAKIGEITRGSAELTQRVAEHRDRIDRMGPVNMAALEEYEQQRERLEFLARQHKDLVQSKQHLEASIAKIDETTKKLFHETFESVRKHFIEMFRRMFNGGKADLILEPCGEDPLLDGGIEIIAQPPGKKLQTLSLLSGGEKAMTAIALLFALFLHKPAPFAVLDEIDAALDDVNVERFKNIVMEFARHTQFLIITHNKQTMQLADCLYGVTMEESGVSKLVSVKFEHADQYVTTAG